MTVEQFAQRNIALAINPPSEMTPTNYRGGNIPLTLLGKNGWAFLQIRGTGIIDLAEAKQMLALLQDFVDIGDDYEHDYAAKQHERLNRGPQA
jgi:hypothetical protein